MGRRSFAAIAGGTVACVALVGALGLMQGPESGRNTRWVAVALAASPHPGDPKVRPLADRMFESREWEMAQLKADLARRPSRVADASDLPSDKRAEAISLLDLLARVQALSIEPLGDPIYRT